MNKTQASIDKLYDDNHLIEFQPNETYSLGTREVFFKKTSSVLFYLEHIYHDRYSLTLNIKAMKHNGILVKAISIPFKINQDGYAVNTNHNWKNDYKTLAEHLYKNGITSKAGSPILFHRLLMALFMNISKNEDVHHLNFKRNDNKLNNLVVIEREEHKRLHDNYPNAHYYNHCEGIFTAINNCGIIDLSLLLSNYENLKKEFSENESSSGDLSSLDSVLQGSCKQSIDSIAACVEGKQRKKDPNVKDLEEILSTVRRHLYINRKQKDSLTRKKDTTNIVKIAETDMAKVRRLHITYIDNTKCFNEFIKASNLGNKEITTCNSYRESLMSIFYGLCYEKNPTKLETMLNHYLNTFNNLEHILSKAG